MGTFQEKRQGDLSHSRFVDRSLTRFDPEKKYVFGPITKDAVGFYASEQDLIKNIGNATDFNYLLSEHSHKITKELQDPRLSVFAQTRKNLISKVHKAVLNRAIKWADAPGALEQMFSEHAAAYGQSVREAEAGKLGEHAVSDALKMRVHYINVPEVMRAKPKIIEDIDDRLMNILLLREKLMTNLIYENHPGNNGKLTENFDSYSKEAMKHSEPGVRNCLLSRLSIFRKVADAVSDGKLEGFESMMAIDEMLRAHDTIRRGAGANPSDKAFSKLEKIEIPDRLFKSK